MQCHSEKADIKENCFSAKSFPSALSKSTVCGQKVQSGNQRIYLFTGFHWICFLGFSPKMCTYMHKSWMIKICAERGEIISWGWKLKWLSAITFCQLPPPPFLAKTKPTGKTTWNICSIRENKPKLLSKRNYFVQREMISFKAKSFRLKRNDFVQREMILFKAKWFCSKRNEFV